MDKRSELVNYFASQGIFESAEVEKKIQELANSLAEAQAKEMGLTDPIDKAYQAYLYATGKDGAGAVPTASTGKAGTAPVPVVNSAQVASITKTLLQQNADRAAMSQSTIIDKYIFEKPAPAEIIPAGTKGVLTETSWNNFMEKINDGTYTVCPDDGEEVDADKRIASTTNFNTLKAAFAAKTPLDVHIGERSLKPAGYYVRRGNVSGTAAASEPMTREELRNFVILQTAGYILRNGEGPAVMLKQIQARNNNATPGSTQAARTVLSDVHKKEAVDAGMYDVARNVTGEMTDARCRAALKVRVIEKGKFLKDGVTPKKITKTFSVSASIKKTELKAEYVDMFATGDQTNDLLSVPDASKLQKLQVMQAQAIAELKSRSTDPQGIIELQAYQNDLAKFDMAAGAAPANAQV